MSLSIEKKYNNLYQLVKITAIVTRSQSNWNGVVGLKKPYTKINVHINWWYKEINIRVSRKNDTSLLPEIH